jgi:hypothetical protein
MNLVKRAFLRKSVLSLLLTAAVIALLVFAGPHAAQAITITVSNPASGLLGGTYTFSIWVAVDSGDLLPLESAELKIINIDTPNPYTITCTDLPRVATTVPKVYATPYGDVEITSHTGTNWGGADDTRYGYGYEYTSGTDNYSLVGSYGYGYVDGNHIGDTYISYIVEWAPIAPWPTGECSIEVIIYGDGSTRFTHQQPYTFTLSAGGAGGGGGGGGVPAGVTFFMESRNPLGEFLNEVTAQSWDKQVILTIYKGTIGKNENGAPLSWVSIIPMEEYPEPPQNIQVIGIPYDFGPDWATFNPPVRITFKYNPATLPEGVDEEKMVLAYYNSVRKEWMVLENIIIDTDKHTISGDASHFTSFAILYAPGLFQEPEPTTTPPTTTPPTTTPPTTTPPTTTPPATTPPTTTPTISPPTEPTTDTGVIVVPPVIAPIDISDSNGINQWVLAGIVFGGAVIIIGLAVYLLWYRRILE